MSLTLNMVGGGGGGLSATDALLRVQAPAGSTVTITKGTITKTDNGHENASNPLFYDYYFIIHQSQFDSVNAWTVTATKGSFTWSDTVVVNNSDEYNVTFNILILYDSGDEYTTLTGGWSFNNNNLGTTSLTKNADNMVLYCSQPSGASANACAYTANAIDTSGYTTINCAYDLVLNQSSSQPDHGNLALRTTVPTNGGWNGSYAFTANLAYGTSQTGSCNIATATAPLYVALREWANPGSGMAKEVTLTIYRIWLE